MCRPGQGGCNHYAQNGIVSDGCQKRSDQWRLFSGRQCIHQNVQREQRKAETNCDAAERSRETLSSGTECDQPDNEQHRRDRGNVE